MTLRMPPGGSTSYPYCRLSSCRLQHSYIDNICWDDSGFGQSGVGGGGRSGGGGWAPSCLAPPADPFVTLVNSGGRAERRDFSAGPDSVQEIVLRVRHLGQGSARPIWFSWRGASETVAPPNRPMDVPVKYRKTESEVSYLDPRAAGAWKTAVGLVEDLDIVLAFGTGPEETV